LFQNSVSANLRFDGQALRKTGQIGLKVRPGFSIKSKEAVSKTEVLEQPQYIKTRDKAGCGEGAVPGVDCYGDNDGHRKAAILRRSFPPVLTHGLIAALVEVFLLSGVYEKSLP
jgi:hypothetical protein